MWESGINPAKKMSEEFKKQMDLLCKISVEGSDTTAMQGMQMSKDELKQCFITMRKNEDIRKKFRNPYIKRLRDNNLRGTMSKSNDYLNLSSGIGGVAANSS